jgi:Protein of unknown function (DUF2933)
MNASTVLLLLLVLACPLSMIWMMRGGHGHAHGGHGHENRNRDGDADAPLMRERSTKGLRELRDEIDQLIEEREQAEDTYFEREPTVGARR